MTFEMEKYFQRLNPEMGMKAGRILELNPNHRLFGLLQVAVAQDEEKAKKIAKILYAQALLMADLPLEKPGEYTDLVSSWCSKPMTEKNPDALHPDFYASGNQAISRSFLFCRY